MGRGKISTDSQTKKKKCDVTFTCLERQIREKERREIFHRREEKKRVYICRKKKNLLRLYLRPGRKKSRTMGGVEKKKRGVTTERAGKGEKEVFSCWLGKGKRKRTIKTLSH